MKTKRKKKNLISRIDFNSIKTTSLIYFLLFAVILLALIWGLLGVSMNRYYERMKITETRSDADRLKAAYQSGNRPFEHAAERIAQNSGVFIRIDTQEHGTKIYVPDSNTQNAQAGIMTYDREIATARSRLADSGLDAISVKIQDGGSELSHLVYASRIGSKNSTDTLYLVAPLYPVQSTVSILERQLRAITVLALFIAALLAYYMSQKLSSPIEGITKSAVELSHGNYNVKFNGGMFTETNELAKTLNTASYEMQRSDSYQRDLIANVTHDLKTPLTMIKSYAEMINDISGDDPVKRKEHLGVIISEADRLNKMVTDMLTMSKLQSNTTSMNKTVFDITEAAEQVFDTYRIMNEQEGYDITLKKPRATYVYGDEDKIKQVMVNFISNAVKYGGDSKSIQIVLKKSRNGRKIRFDVIDHGIGIPKDEIGHVWDRYYRASANHKQDIDGSGLGLSIVRGILSLHNAGYGVESEEGKGSDFWFELDTVKKPKDQPAEQN